LTVRVPGAAQMLDVSVNCVWDLIRKREVRVSRFGNVTLIHVDSIREYLQKHADRPPDIRGPRRKRLLDDRSSADAQERAAATAAIGRRKAAPSAPPEGQPTDEGE